MSATINVLSQTSNSIAVTVDNTSPILASDGSLNAPAIVGVGFDTECDANIVTQTVAAVAFDGSGSEDVSSS